MCAILAESAGVYLLMSVGEKPNAESIVFPPIINAALAVGAITIVGGFFRSTPGFSLPCKQDSRTCLNAVARSAHFGPKQV